ncbi:hypothetical protein [Halalkalibacter akibai]|uniref:Copper amine oxidase-like N-terminal domain-containing protein n=1 Tax=Halalkalibacter akibai (strain ATCC 43226 / DSM 21942 / CIP 109018 / JCM 9157 / 1139) TaxID=1236973 RepID=W4QZL8_HALA3|nr:hypothetical protein [Halalkalibacter akibai]GAE37575.1 hypothetical protein JCM9157_4886 [Halalkalibacter akibai JCM 9157]
MNKKSLPGILAIMILSFGGYMVMAQGQELETVEEVQQASKYIQFTGKVEKVETETVSIRVVNEDGNEMIFPLSDEVLVMDSTGNFLIKEEFTTGMDVDVYYDQNKPMPMIYPASITPDLIIVKNKESHQVKVAKFDSNLISDDFKLKLHIDEQTIVVNERDEEIQEADLINKELVVFYTISTRSIPAQTTPVKVVKLMD